jgi:hypothetical protein
MSVIAAGIQIVEGRAVLVELLARGGRFWLRLPGGAERPLSRDAARVVLGVLGDPHERARSETP